MKCAGGDEMRVHHGGVGLAQTDRVERVLVRRNDKVTAYHDVRLTQPDRNRVNVLGGWGASRKWLNTAPPFCDMPVMSWTDAPLPSRWAAMARTAPTVTTPVPPTPVTSTLNTRSSAGVSGSGKTFFEPRRYRDFIRLSQAASHNGN